MGKSEEETHNENKLESFGFDGEEYFLYDCVYFQNEDESEEPYIGKIVKIMDNQKEVKVVWFFRPMEVEKWLRNKEVYILVHEIFLASGEGPGVANINPVGAIVKKCNVVCISEDIRNPQPSKEERQKADFVFSRTFDVKECTFSDKIDNIISGIEVKHFFNSKECSALSGSQEPKGAEVKNPKSSGSEKDDLKAPIVQGGKVDKMKSVGVLYHSRSLQSTPFEETVRFGDSAKCSLDGEVNGNAGLVRKPKIRCKETGVHVRHDRTTDRGISSSVSPSKKAKLAGKEAAPKPAGEKSTKDDRVISRKRPAEFVGRGAAPELAQKKGRITQTQYRSITEPEKDLVRHDRGFLTATTNEKKLDLGKRREGAIDFVGQHNWISSPLNRKNKGTLLSNKEAPEAPQQKKMIKSASHTVETQQTVDKSKWFNFQQSVTTWEEKMDRAYNQGTLVRLQNLDPSYSAAEVQEIMWTYLNVKCTAKVLQRSTFSSPHNGQALLIFKTEEKAKMVIKQLWDRCLMLPNGRPLIAQRGAPRVLQKSTKLVGHLTIDRNMNREQRNAVSTSHCAQPNNIEYDLALEWILEQKQSEAYWREFYEVQGKQMADLKAQLKKH